MWIRLGVARQGEVSPCLSTKPRKSQLQWALRIEALEEVATRMRIQLQITGSTKSWSMLLTRPCYRIKWPHQTIVNRTLQQTWIRRPVRIRPLKSLPQSEMNWIKQTQHVCIKHNISTKLFQVQMPHPKNSSAIMAREWSGSSSAYQRKVPTCQIE